MRHKACTSKSQLKELLKRDNPVGPRVDGNPQKAASHQAKEKANPCENEKPVFIKGMKPVGKTSNIGAARFEAITNAERDGTKIPSLGNVQGCRATSSSEKEIP